MDAGRIIPQWIVCPSVALLAVLAATPASAQVSNCRPDARQASGAEYRICMPAPGRWNGDLVLYAHGYVAFNEPLEIPEDQLTLPDGASVPAIVNALGFAFATTSYAKNGLAVLEGIEDLRNLVDTFTAAVGAPSRVFLVGPSEGGMITALAVERHPGTFNGGLSACGPIGDFRRQIDYIGDFRVVFDFFFPGLLPGSATTVPAELITNYETVYVPKIKAAIAAHPQRARQVLAVTKAPSGPDGANIEETFVSVLWYAVFATNDASQQLGGQPFDNRQRWYRGSSVDLLLNLFVERADADSQALLAIEAGYQSSGLLARPLVTMHTTGDQIIPYWHEPLYKAKVMAMGSDALHDNIPVFRYGHCNFKASEVVVGFLLLLQRAGGQPVAQEAIDAVLTDVSAH